jgi:hypothetical protein
VIIADNTADSPPTGLGGTSATATIRSMRITRAAGVVLKNAVANASRFGSRSTPGTVRASIIADATRFAGADVRGRPLLFTPNPRQAGSSVSHWDQSASRNLLMEPAINLDLTSFLVPPFDLTLPLLQDMGW